jgi:uncharacterized protein
MIVDCCTHVWTSPAQLGDGAETALRRAGLAPDAPAGPAALAEAAQCVAKSLVFAFRSELLNANVPNDLVAEHVARDTQTRIGVAAVDPTRKGALAEAAECLARKEFRGLTLSPAAQGFHPLDTRAMAIYELAAARRAPIFLCPGPGVTPRGLLEFARPALLDELARAVPNLTLVISGMGWPHIAECVALMSEHPRVFADVAGLVARPWSAYNALILAHEGQVTEQVLWASGFPLLAPAAAIEGVYRFQEIAGGTNLPTVPREVLRSILERDSLTALGIARAGEAPPPRAAQPDEEEF